MYKACSHLPSLHTQIELLPLPPRRQLRLPLYIVSATGAPSPTTTTIPIDAPHHDPPRHRQILVADPRAAPLLLMPLVINTLKLGGALGAQPLREKQAAGACGADSARVADRCR